MSFLSLQRKKFLVLLPLGWFLSFAIASEGAPLKSRKTIDMIREAYFASKKNLTSGTGTGTYEVYTQDSADAAVSLDIKAKVKIWFDKEKYRIDLTYEKNPKTTRSETIIFDGDVLIKTESWSPPAKLMAKMKEEPTRTQVFHVDKDKPLASKANFHFTPTRLPDVAFRIGPQLEREPDKIQVSKQPEGGHLARYVNPSKDVLEVDFPLQYDFNASVFRLYIDGNQNNLGLESKGVWEKARGIWYVKSISESFYNRTITRAKRVLTYDQFEPNVPVDKKLFRVSSVRMAPNSSIVDRPPTGLPKVYRNRPQGGTDSGDVDSMAEYIKTLGDNPRQHSSLWMRFSLLLTAGTLLVILGAILMWRRRRLRQRSERAGSDD